MQQHEAASPVSRVPATLKSPHLLLMGAAFFWAGNFIVGRALRGDIPPVSLNVWRWTIALIILLPLSFAHLRQYHLLLAEQWKLIVGLGATGIAAFHTCVYVALTTTPAVNALLFLSTAPVVIALLSWLAFGETATLRQGLGILISLLGALVLIARGNSTTLMSLRFNPGDLWMLIAVPMWAIYSVLLKRRPSQVPQLALLTASVIVGLVLLLPLYLWQVGRGETMVMTGANMLGLLYIAVCASVIAFLCWNRGVAEIGPVKAGLFIHLMPVFGAILAVVFLGEAVAFYQIFGAVLVFSGIALTNQRRTNV